MKRMLYNRKLSWIVSKTISVLLLPVLSFTGCLETTREIPITLTVSSSPLNFLSTGDEQSITIDSNTNAWRLDCDASWVTITPSSGAKKATVTVRAGANGATGNRTATITITGTGILKPRTVSVSQAGNTTSNPPSIDIEMVQVEGGTFTMGCTSEQGSDCDEDETPSHSVTLSPFYIGKYEVTQVQWKAVMGDNPSYFKKGDNYPVENVSWNDIVGTSGASTVINGITYYANGFIYKLNQMTGIQYRLPTEAEWEFAARGRNSGRFKYSGSNTVGNVAWYLDNIPSQTEGNSGYGTQHVGTKSANELGIYDMSGNVWEWCSDWFGSYNGSSQSNPTGPSSGSSRVLRGGSWSDFARFVRASFRYSRAPDFRINDLGFRLACSSK